MEQNFNDAIKQMQQQALNGRKPHTIICPHCGEHRLDRLRPVASGTVHCLQCASEFEVKE